MNFDQTRNFYTVYKYKFLDSTEWTVPLQTNCFGTFFSDTKVKNAIETESSKSIEFNIFVNTDPKSNTALCNLCLLNKEEVISFLDEIKQWINFSYTLEYEEKCFYINLITSTNLLGNKLLLTLVRFLWEGPFNICLKEAIELKKRNYFPKLTLLYTHLLVQTSLYRDCAQPHGLISHPTKPIPIYTKLKLKNKLKIPANDRNPVNNFFNNPGGDFTFYAGGSLYKTNTPNNLFLKDGKLAMEDADISSRVENYHNINYKTLFGEQK